MTEDGTTTNEADVGNTTFERQRSYACLPKSLNPDARSSDMADDILDRVIVPVSDEKDARRTAKAVAPYFNGSELVAVYVVEKGGGAPDKAPMEAVEEHGRKALNAFEKVMSEHGIEVEKDVLYGTDVADTVLGEAEKKDATVAFVAREGGRFVRLLTGDDSLAFVTKNRIPVVSLPRPE